MSGMTTLTCLETLVRETRQPEAEVILAVRQAAKSQELVPVGSLGIVVKAYRLEYLSLSEAQRLVTDLYDVSTLFVTRAIVELAIEQLGEQSGGRE